MSPAPLVRPLYIHYTFPRDNLENKAVLSLALKYRAWLSEVLLLI